MSDSAAASLDHRRKRLKFRSWHRGIKEMDLILGHFADSALDEMDAATLDQYETLIEAPDVQLYDWITGRSAPPPEHDTPLFKQIRELGYMKETLWRQTAPRGG